MWFWEICTLNIKSLLTWAVHFAEWPGPWLYRPEQSPCAFDRHMNTPLYSLTFGTGSPLLQKSTLRLVIVSTIFCWSEATVQSFLHEFQKAFGSRQHKGSLQAFLVNFDWMQIVGLFGKPHYSFNCFFSSSILLSNDNHLHFQDPMGSWCFVMSLSPSSLCFPLSWQEACSSWSSPQPP